MRTYSWGISVLTLLACLEARTRADLISVTPPLSLSFQGDITYQNFEVPTFVGRGAILSATLTGTSSVTSTIGYDTNFQDGPGVLRFTDVITNNSGQAWTGLQFHLGSTTGTFFHDGATPTIDSVLDPTGPNPVVTAVTKYDNGNNGGIIVLSPD